MTRTALVTGVAGQDGILLARLLHSEGYRVIGTVQPGSVSPLRTYLAGIEIEQHDLRDAAGFDRMLEASAPDEVYNLAGFTSVGASWDQPELVEAVNAVAVESMLDSLVATRERTGRAPRFFQASSSEVFGPDAVNPQDESTAHDPQSPYAVSKSQAHRTTVRRREEDGLFACVGILYNHESPLRRTQFVTRKITRAAAEIAAGVRDSLPLGNTAVSRDWGSARDYVVAMHRMLSQDEPEDYVVATGRLHSLGDFLEGAFAAAGVDDPWSYVVQDPALMRSSDPLGPTGDAAKARQQLGWSTTQDFGDLVAEMVAVDVRRLESGVEEDPSYVSAPRD